MATDVNVTQNQERAPERTRTGQFYRPHVDILETQHELILVADMPGVASDCIEVDFEDGVLTLQGSIHPRYDEDANFLLCEYGIGDFHRTFRVSEQIDSGKIHAECGDGVLKVHLPKAEAAKPRKIEVQAAG